MSIKSGVLTLCVFLALSDFASGFGTVEELRAAHPEFFDYGRVSVVTNGGIPYYVCNGQAIRHFKDIPINRDTKIRTSARLRAQDNLSEFLSKDKSSREIEVSGFRQIAREIFGDRVFYVFAVPVKNVKFAAVLRNEDTSEPSKTNTVAAANRKNPPSAEKPTEGGAVADADWMALMDAVERNPVDAHSHAHLAECLLKANSLDEAEKSACRAVELLLPLMTFSAKDCDIRDLLLAASVLLECADYQNARKAYNAVKKLNRQEFSREVLASLSKIRLDIGFE